MASTENFGEPPQAITRRSCDVIVWHYGYATVVAQPNGLSAGHASLPVVDPSESARLLYPHRGMSSGEMLQFAKGDESRADSTLARFEGGS